MEKKIYAFNIKIGMELKTVWGYAPVVDVEVIDGTVEYNGKTYPTRETIVTVESDKISKYTYKATETVYVNVPEVKAEPVVVNVATADELVMPERVEADVESTTEDTPKATTFRRYTRGFKRADLKVMAIFRKYFIPVEKPDKNNEASNPKSVLITQTSGEMIINLNGRTLPKPVLMEVQTIIDETGVKTKYIP